MEMQTGHVETFQHRFSQADLDRFAALTRDNNPIHVDPGFSTRTRFGRTVAHGMLLYSIICRVLSHQFADSGLIQRYQDLKFPHPTYTDTEISVQLEVMDVHPDAKMYDIRTVIQLPDGNYACEGRTTVCNAGMKNSFSGQIPDRDEFQVSESKRLKNLALGQTATTKRIFTPQDLAEYVDLAGDQNPLLTNTDFAQYLGYTDCVVPGPLLSGMFSDLLGTQLPGRGTNWLKQTLYFPAPACVGDEIIAAVEIIRLRPDKDLVNLRDTCRSAAGRLVCQAESLVFVKDLEDPL